MNYSDRLGTENIQKLLVKLSIPSIIGMLAISIYHIADTIFIGHGVGAMAIAGVSVAMPLLMTLNVFGHAIGIGGASIISRAFGSKDKEKAEKTLNQLMWLIIQINFVIYFIAYLQLEFLLKVFGADETIMPYAYDYAVVALIGSFFLNILFVVMNTIRAEGNAKYPMLIQLIAASLNLVLNPIFIFVLEWGVTGAAIATSVSQFFGATMAIVYYTHLKRSSLKLRFSMILTKPKDWSIIKETLAIGSSSFARQMATSVMAIALNHSLLIYTGPLGVAAFGVIYRLSMFFFMPLFGINQGFMPIVGYNYGAKNPERVIKSIKISSIYSTVLCLLAFIVFYFFDETLIGMFTPDKELIEIGSKALRIFIIAFPVIGFQIIGSGLFQAIGKAWSALFLALSRQVLFLIPFIFIFPLYWGEDGIWYSFPASDILAFIITFFMLWYRVIKIKKMNIK